MDINYWSILVDILSVANTGEGGGGGGGGEGGHEPPPQKKNLTCKNNDTKYHTLHCLGTSGTRKHTNI